MNTKSHQTGEPRGPLPSGGKTPANLLSLEYPRALRARCGVQGHCPCQTGEPWHLYYAQYGDDLESSSF